MTRKYGTIALAAALVATGGCASVRDRVSTESGIGAVLGGLGGYLLGDVIGGKRDRTEKILGAGIGAIAGAAVGDYMDRQQKELERETAGTGVEVIRSGDDLVLRMPAGITFDVNSYAVKPQFSGTLDQVASTFAEYPSTMIDVYGHTDATGGDAINVPLSQSRARAVASYLSQRGVNPTRIATQGFGASQPVAGNDSEAGRQANRRVEIKIVPVTQGA